MEAILILLKKLRLKYELEYRFNPHRRWRFDAAIMDVPLDDPYYVGKTCKVAVEYEGGVWSKGRHTRGAGYIKDCEKYNEAQLMGWIVLRYTSDSSISKIEDDIKRAMEVRHGKNNRKSN